MRIILSENRFNSLFSDWLERSGINIEFHSMPGYINGYDERIVTGCLNFSKRGNNFGLRNFYVYKFKVGEDNELQFYESNGRPERLREFKMFPPEVIKDYLIELSRKHQKQRLTESELIRVHKRIVKESEEIDGEEYMNHLIEKGCSNIQAYYLTQLEISDDLNWKSMFETYGEDIVNELFSNDYHNFLDFVFKINQYAEDKPLSFIYRRWDGTHHTMIDILTEYFFKGDKKLMIEKYGEYLEREIKFIEFTKYNVVNTELMLYKSYLKYKNDWRGFEEFIPDIYDKYGGYIEPFNTYSPEELMEILYDSPPY